MRLQLKVWPLMVDVGAGRLIPGASRLAPAVIVPPSTAVFTSGRSALARRTAPSTFSSPAPWSSKFAPAIGCALYCKMALISGGVSPGLACNISATVPATAGAAIEVPLMVMSVFRLACSLPPSGVVSTG